MLPERLVNSVDALTEEEFEDLSLLELLALYSTEVSADGAGAGAPRIVRIPVRVIRGSMARVDLTREET